MKNCNLKFSIQCEVCASVDHMLLSVLIARCSIGLYSMTDLKL